MEDNKIIVPVKQESKAVVDNGLTSFQGAVDLLLQKRQYFIDKVLPILINGTDYFEIPSYPRDTTKPKGIDGKHPYKKNPDGTQVINIKKSLGKAGAEKLASLYKFVAAFKQDNEVKNMLPGVKDMVAFVCVLTQDDKVVGEGRGADTLSNNYGDPNKTIKMSQKRAFVDSIIRATGLSDLFTQDIEDEPIKTSEPAKVYTLQAQVASESAQYRKVVPAYQEPKVINKEQEKTMTQLCPKCNKPLYKSKYPDKETGAEYYYCSGYRDVPKCYYKVMIDDGLDKVKDMDLNEMESLNNTAPF